MQVVNTTFALKIQSVRSGVSVSCLCAFALLFGAGSGIAKERRPPSTAAHSIVSSNYVRERLTDGSWKPETYVFGEGNLIDRSGRDKSLTELSFHEMCEVLAVALALEDYLPAPNAEEADLLIVVSWGKTMPHDDGMADASLAGMSSAMSSIGNISRDIQQRAAETGQAATPTSAESSQLSSLESEMTTMLMMQDMADRARRRANDYNARLLGYAPALYDAYEGMPFGPQRTHLDSLIEEIEAPRYFVILQAYDFHKLVRLKEKELHWMTRFSIRAKGRRFDENLAAMAAAASSVFGRENGQLKRHLRPGRGRIGELELIGVEEAPEQKD